MQESTFSILLDVFLLLCSFILVLGLAYYCTRKIALLKQGSTRSKNMQIIEVLPLAVGQVIYIVKIGEEYHLFTATKERLEHCLKLDEEKLTFEQIQTVGFKDYLSKYTKNNQESK